MEDNYSGDPDLTDHESGVIDFKDEVSPMITGYGDEFNGNGPDEICADNGDPSAYTSLLSTCTENSVEDYMKNTFNNK
jgi:hypothetical protein